VLLSRFDEVELSLQQRSAQNLAKNTAKKKTGWGADSGLGYRSLSADTDSLEAGMDFRQQDDLTDGLMTQLLQVLTAFLPVEDSRESFDRSPPPELWALFRASLLLEKVGALVRNDSIADMTARKGLYRAVMAFVGGIARHAGFVKILTEKRVEKKRSPGLQALAASSSSSSFVYDNSEGALAPSVFTASEAAY
jgi:hypothetical protein